MVDILKIKKLSELEEKLKEHVTEENWRELLFITLNYTSLNKVYIDEYNFRKLQDNSGTYAEMFEISKEKDRIEKIKPTLCNITYSVDFSSPLFENFKELYSKLFNHKDDMLKITFANYTEKLIFNYIKINQSKLSNFKVIKDLERLLETLKQLSIDNIIENETYDFINNLIIDKQKLSGLNILRDFVFVLLNSDDIREYLSFLSNPTEVINKDLHPIEIFKRIYQNDNSKKNSFSKKSILIEKLLLKKSIFDFPVNVDDVGVYKLHLYNIINKEDRLFSKRMYHGEEELLLNNIKLSQGSLINELDLNYLSNFIKLINRSRVSYENLSKRIRIIKRLREENKEVDYDKVSKYANIDIPGYLILGEKGKGGASDFYEGIRDGLGWRKRAIRIFYGDRNKSTSIKGVRKDIGTFRMFEKGMELQELLSEEYDFIVKVYDWGKLNNRKFYSIEELIDCTLEDKLGEDKSKRLKDFPKIFLETAAILHVLHNSKDEVYDNLINTDKSRFINSINYRLREDIEMKYENEDLIGNNNSITLLHTDIKLENIGVHKEKIKILDLSTAITNKDEKRNYYSGQRAYSAPEVISRNEYSKKSDVYSLGVCMFRYLTGEFPNNFGDYRHEDFISLKEELKKDATKNIYAKNLEEQCIKISDLSLRKIIYYCLLWDKKERINTYRLCQILERKIFPELLIFNT